jgi:hypothetical protein
MSFADPQKVKVGAKEYEMPRVATGDHNSEYAYSDGTAILKASSAYGNRTRQTIRLDLSKIAADPFIPAQNVKLGMSAYLVVDRPVAGYTNTEAEEAVKGFIESLSATSYTLVKKLLAGES